MVSLVNNAFMKFEKRAEGVDVNKLVEAFVDNGPLFTLLGNADHQVLHGRRGTGKTHALKYLGESRNTAGDISAFIDLRTVGSNNSIYADPSLPLNERATRLMLDVLTETHGRLYDYLVTYAEKYDLAITGPLLDKFAKSIGEVHVVGDIEREEKSGSKDTRLRDQQVNVSTDFTKNTFGFSEKLSRSNEESAEARVVRKGAERYHLHFGTVMASLRDIMAAIKGVRLWILLDEWSTLPIDLQPYLADMFKRCVLPVQGITLKIAAIEQRSRFKLHAPSGGYVGLEIGADIPTDVNLDDFLVFENQPNRARDFYKQLFFKHFQAIDPTGTGETPDTPNKLVSIGFTQVNVFDELVQAAEGVPRDAMNILAIAATSALDNKIDMKRIRNAAREWYQRGKERDLNSNPDCLKLLHFIVDDVIGKKSARAFLIRSNARDNLIDELFDARVLHILKRNVAGKDEPGARFDVYKIDYGCYVELLTTEKAPQHLLLIDDEGEAGAESEVDYQVPQDDYRSIRRAVLKLEAFYNT